MKRLVVPSLTLLSTLATVQARADETYADEALKKEIMKEEDPEDADGWIFKAKVGASFSFNHNDNVVGTADGSTLIIGGVLGGSARLKDGRHKWENVLSIQETVTQTPQLDRLVKSLDQLDLTTLYTYRFEDPSWMGLFGKALFNTQLFEGQLVAESDIEVVRTTEAGSSFSRDNTSDYYRGGGTRTVAAGEDLTLTSSFEPLNMRQSLGLFADPVRDDAFKVSVKLGIGLQEILSQGGDVRVGSFEDPDTGQTVVVVRELEDGVFELGAEAELDIRGEPIKEIVSYYLTLNAFYPPLSSSTLDLGFGDSINLRLKAGLSVKVSKMISVDYVLTVLRIPSVTTDFQVQNGLLISAAFELL